MIDGHKFILNVPSKTGVEEMHVEERWEQSVIKNLSVDLQHQNPNAKGLSVRNIYYCKKFYLLYRQYFAIVPQSVAQLENDFAVFWVLRNAPIYNRLPIISLT